MPKAKGKSSLPVHVLRAIQEENTSLLRAMGRKGGLSRAKQLDIERTVESLFQEEIAKEHWQQILEIHADICPIDL